MKNYKKNCHNKSHFNLKSSLLTQDFSVWLSVQYTLNNLYLTQKQKKYAPKTYRPRVLAQTCSVWTLYQSKLLKNMFCRRKIPHTGDTTLSTDADSRTNTNLRGCMILKKIYSIGCVIFFFFWGEGWQKNTQTHRQTLQLLDQLGLEGRVGENQLFWSNIMNL